MRSLFHLLLCAAAALAAGCAEGGRTDEQTPVEEAPKNLVYGIDADNYRLERGEVQHGETLGRILNRFGSRSSASLPSPSTGWTARPPASGP